MPAKEPAPAIVLDLLRREGAVFDQLEDLAARQKELVVCSEMGPLLVLLDRRRELSAELTCIERELAPVRRNWKGLRPMLPPDEQSAADQLMASAGDRLRRLMEGDEEDARKLSIRKQSVGQTLQSTGLTHNALSAYQQGNERVHRLDCTESGI